MRGCEPPLADGPRHRGHLHDGDKLAHEHLYWDQASVLVQLGLLPPGGLPVVGAEGARSVLDRSIPLNGLLRRVHPLGSTVS
jgi:hypothetical protein